MPKIEFDSATLPPEDVTPLAVPDLSLAEMKAGLVEQIDFTGQFYAVRIARGQASKEDMDRHISVLLAAIHALDRADNGEDIRRGYPIRKPSLEDLAPRCPPKKTPEERIALSAPAPAPRRTSNPKPFNDALPDNLAAVPEPHDLA